MLLLSVLFCFNFSYCSQAPNSNISQGAIETIKSDLEKTQAGYVQGFSTLDMPLSGLSSYEVKVKLVIVKPDRQPEEEFSSSVTQLLRNAGNEIGEKVEDIKFLEGKMETLVSQDYIQAIKPYLEKFYAGYDEELNPVAISPFTAAAAESSISTLSAVGNAIEDELGRLILSKKKRRKITEVADWVKDFYEPRKKLFSEKCPQVVSISDSEYMLYVLQGLSKFVTTETDEESDLPDKNIQLLNFFMSFYKDVLIPTKHALIQKTSEYIQRGRVSLDYKISDEKYFDAVLDVLSKHTCLNDINVLRFEIIDNFINMLEEDDQLIAQWKAKKTVEYLSRCQISESEFAALSFGKQNAVLFVASILDSPIGKQYSKEPSKDHKRLLDDLLQAIKPLQRSISESNQALIQFKNSPFKEEVFSNCEEIILCGMIKALSKKEFNNLRYQIQKDKIIWNRSLLEGILEGIRAELRSLRADFFKRPVLASKKKNEERAERDKDAQVARKKEIEEELRLERKRQEEEASRVSAVVAAQRAAQAEKKESSLQKKREEALRIARMAEEKKQLELFSEEEKRKRQALKNSELNERKRIEDQKDEILRQFRLLLENQRIRYIKEVGDNCDRMLEEHSKSLQDALEESIQAFQMRQRRILNKNIRKYCSKILTPHGFIHNPYAQSSYVFTKKKDDAL